MSEFMQKKLGEVLAFSRIGIECAERAGDSFTAAFPETTTEDFIKQLNEQAETILEFADDVTNTKADATTAKLRGMMETYIGDEWDNSAEILEWMGFFLGSAKVHWGIVEGGGEASDNSQLQTTAMSAISFFDQMLNQAVDSLRKFGRDRA